MGILYKLKLFTVNEVAKQTLKVLKSTQSLLKQVFHIAFIIQRCVWTGQHVEKHCNTFFLSSE